MTTTNEIISDFAAASSLDEWIDRGSHLLKTSAAAIAAKDERFSRGFANLLGETKRLEGRDQLRAIAFAWRLTAVSAMRSHRRELLGWLTEPINEPAVLPLALDEPEDRKYLFDALSIARDPWIWPYLVRSMVNDKDGVVVRGAAADALVKRQEMLVCSFELLGSETKALKLDQKEPDIGRARVMIQNLDALAKAIWMQPDELRIGNGFGEAFRSLVSSACSKNVGDKDVRIALVKSAINLFLQIARLEPEISSNPKSYEFVRPLKAMFAPADWPDELADDLHRLGTLAADRLVFLLKLDRPDNELRSMVIEITGQVVGSLLLKKRAEAEDGLSEGQRHWLEKGRARAAKAINEVASESVLARFDEELAELLRSADNMRQTFPRLKQDFELEAELLPDVLRSSLEQNLDRSDAMNSEVIRLAEQRGLIIKGRIGDVVEFDPKFHEPLPEAVGEKKVRMRSQPVLRSLEGGKTIVILKSKVDRV